ncbi:hypothetical protein DFH09DRAFT_1294359 [Mycena vulgaris]|nr:hypothetical protein DFH09DRAFT_1294359 [Mycena vulgaris]
MIGPWIQTATHKILHLPEYLDFYPLRTAVFNLSDLLNRAVVVDVVSTIASRGKGRGDIERKTRREKKGDQKRTFKKSSRPRYTLDLRSQRARFNVPDLHSWGSVEVEAVGASWWAIRRSKWPPATPSRRPVCGPVLPVLPLVGSIPMTTPSRTAVDTANIPAGGRPPDHLVVRRHPNGTVIAHGNLSPASQRPYLPLRKVLSTPVVVRDKPGTPVKYDNTMSKYSECRPVITSSTGSRLFATP